jgi:hypothetical protein
VTLLPKPPKRGPKPKKRIPHGKRPAKRSAKDTLLRRLKSKAWKAFSVWVRRPEADGLVTCYTCGTRKLPAQMDAGHFIHGKLDFEPFQIRPQCTHCNRFLHGNLGIYAENLVRERGLYALDQLRLAANVHYGYSIEELEAIIAMYSKEP